MTGSLVTVRSRTMKRETSPMTIRSSTVLIRSAGPNATGVPCRLTSTRYGVILACEEKVINARVRIPLTPRDVRAARIQYCRCRSRSPQRWKNARSPAIRPSTVAGELPSPRFLNIGGHHLSKTQEPGRRGQRIRQLRRHLDDQPGVDDGPSQDRQRQPETLVRRVRLEGRDP